MTHVVSQSNMDGAGNDLTAETQTDAQLRKIIDAIPGADRLSAPSLQHGLGHRAHRFGLVQR
jgi:hypothetical protein